MAQKGDDSLEIQQLVEKIFDEFKEGLYFKEFAELTKRVSSELYFSIFDMIYQFVPCAKSFFLMRRNYMKFLETG